MCETFQLFFCLKIHIIKEIADNMIGDIFIKMETIGVETLKKDLSFTGDILIDNTFLLLPKTAELSDEMIAAVKEWGFTEVICDGGLSLGGDIGVSKDEEEDSDVPKEKISLNVKKAIEISKNVKLDNSDKARMEMVQQVYDEYMNYIENVFTHYVTHKEIDQEELSDTVQELCIFIKEHRRYILRVTPSVETSKKNFLVIHSMRSTVLAIAIAMQLHLPLSKMIELGVTCILHEIGMLRIPPQLYMSTKKLTPGEKAQISKHTLFGYSIIKDFDFPLQIQLGILEHHEKENGTGYPRRLTGDKISSLAKIIAVACTYEAISSPRSYKDERSTFDALLEMIQNKDHQYDDTVLKALLYTVSLYPIGTFVYLSNRKVAEVIDSNPDNPKCPVVQSLTEKDSDGSPKVIQTGTDGLSILRILSRQEKIDILKLVEEKYNAISQAQQELENIKAEQNNKQAESSSDEEISETKAEEISENKEEKVTENVPSQPLSDSEIEEVDISIFQ